MAQMTDAYSQSFLLRKRLGRIEERIVALERRIAPDSEADESVANLAAELTRRVEAVEGICEHWAKLGFDAQEGELGKQIEENRKELSKLQRLVKKMAKEAKAAAAEESDAAS